MAKRKPTKEKKDRKIFSRTAKKTKAINITPKIMRGGTRLWKSNYMHSKIH